MYKVGICGHFGKGKNLLNGQTVKTKILTDELKRQLKREIMTVDSHDWKKKPITLFIKCLQLIKRCNNIIILPAKKGVKILVPLFSAINRIYHRNLHYVVVGGWLPEILKNNSLLKHQLKKFSGLFVETYAMVKILNEMGLNNVYHMPNFKRLKVLSETELIYSKNEPYKLCTFSRVMREKGIEDAIEAVITINSELNRTAYKLDIYGQIDKSYEERFKKLMDTSPNYISYKGYVQYNRSTEILKNYMALLFPTRYEGEGFPGTVIDAFSAGLPVIASDWKYNSEVIRNGETGFIYDGSVAGLNMVLQEIIKKPDKVLMMKKNCINEVKKYDPQIIVKGFIEKLDLN